MKTSLISFLLAFNALANTTIDKSTLIEGFAKNYELTSSMHEKKINLDCQSFFHKFDIYEKNILVSEEFITQKECQILETKVDICLKKKKMVCFDNMDIYAASCECEA